MRNINELIGIINGISYDGIINKLEVAGLSSWVKKNRNLSYEPRQARLISLVEQVLEARGYIRYRTAFHRAENRNSPAVRGQGRFQVSDTDNAADVHSGGGGTY